MVTHSPDRPPPAEPRRTRSINIGSPAPYTDAVEAWAAALGASNVGVLRAALELAARRVAEAAPGTPQAEAARVFLQESGKIRDRHRWAGVLQLDQDSHQDPDVMAAMREGLLAMREQLSVTRALADEIRQENRQQLEAA